MTEYYVGHKLPDGSIEECILLLNEPHLNQRISDRMLGLIHMDMLTDALDKAFQMDEVFNAVFYDMKYGEAFILELKDLHCSVLCSVKDIETIEVHSLWRGFKKLRKGIGEHIIQIRENTVRLFTFAEGGVYNVWSPCEA